MMARKRKETYSVRLPSGFPHFGSAAVEQMLTVLFAQRVPLADDPESGNKFLKLTLPRAQVHALQALANGDTAGVALRRLVATFAGTSLPAPRHPVPALPTPILSSWTGGGERGVLAAGAGLQSDPAAPPTARLGQPSTAALLRKRRRGHAPSPDQLPRQASCDTDSSGVP